MTKEEFQNKLIYGAVVCIVAIIALTVLKVWVSDLGTQPSKDDIQVSGIVERVKTKTQDITDIYISDEVYILSSRHSDGGCQSIKPGDNVSLTIHPNGLIVHCEYK